ncbi:hypothetical protein NC653_040585 [Populus alba x Populus x berolinensis]|uniref:P5A-ATPase transmembrane helical hairpin domain-containing protein n=1 Tax=Populus alba x Populus x berolinensis TaxID=444605 RepID=A0AAD6L7J3_9ROSI|nr:hypothetical protein NC653_040585 [Populus alba x Populus x berolinensis]
MVTILPSIDIVDALIVLGGLVSIHVLASLFTVWSVDFKCFTQYRKANDIYAADSCKLHRGVTNDVEYRMIEEFVKIMFMVEKFDRMDI